VTLAPAFLFLAVLAGAPPAAAFDGTLVYGTTGGPGYARVIRLAHGGAANGRLVASFHVGEPNGDGLLVYQSNDGGANWTPLSSMLDPSYSSRTCCATIFELPAAMGSMAAGTLLLSASEGAAGAAGHEIKVWSSPDHGQTWTYLSSCAKTSGVAGLWEPSFAVAADGELLCFYSDETQPGHSQILAHVASKDGGKTWSAPTFDVASGVASNRPGMATVVRLGSGAYVMSFEVCGDGDCRAHVKTSPDGMDWSPASDLGSPIATADGWYLAHTPYVTWLPGGGPDGQLVASGWYFDDPNGVEQSVSGSILLTNASAGAGPWSVLPAPFDFASGPSSGYSSPLLPSTDGTDVLYLAATPVNGGSELRQATANAGILPYAAPFAGGTDSGWLAYGGAFAVQSGDYVDSNAGAGNKAVAGSTAWTDYTLYGDVQLSASGQVGLLARASHPAVGVGYYAAVDVASGSLVFGRENNGWTELGSAPMPNGVATGQWYRVAIRAVGCSFVASAIEVGASGAPAAIQASDPGCFASGQIGVRDFLAPSRWRNVEVIAGGDPCSDQSDGAVCTQGSCLAGHCVPAADGGAADASTVEAAASSGDDASAVSDASSVNDDASSGDASSANDATVGGGGQPALPDAGAVGVAPHGDAPATSNSASMSPGAGSGGCACHVSKATSGWGAACVAPLAVVTFLGRRRRRASKPTRRT
jgi:hypothetical protein